jgi:hypothetical protein
MSIIQPGQWKAAPESGQLMLPTAPGRTLREESQPGLCGLFCGARPAGIAREPA